MKLAVLLLTLALALAAQAQNVEYYLASLAGSNEAPPNNSPYTGKAFVAYFPDTNKFTFRISANVPFAINSHFHQAAVGVSGPVIFPLARTNGIVNNLTNVAFAPLTVANLRAQLYYVNIHTTAVPAGEIRGQVLPAPSCNNGVRNVFDCVCNPGYTGTFCNTLKTCPAISENGISFPPTNAFATAEVKCSGAFLGTVTKTCQEDGTWGATSSTCVPACPHEIYGRATWAATLPNTAASGICEPGSTGSPTRFCNPDATWSTNVANICQKRVCAAETAGEVSWPAIPSLSTFSTYCPIGFTGIVSRACNAAGTWEEIQGQCTPSSDCPAQTYAYATWPATTAGGRSTGTCIQGYSGNPTRACSSGGVWATNVAFLCTRNTCAADTVDGVSFPKSLSETVARGTCPAGTHGAPSRTCRTDGTWGSVSGSCTSNGQCPAELYGRALWDLTNGGNLAVGTCIPGWTGAPQRRCLSDGTWATNINFHCARV